MLEDTILVHKEVFHALTLIYTKMFLSMASKVIACILDYLQEFYKIFSGYKPSQMV
jgi:hypothetical protein